MKITYERILKNADDFFDGESNEKKFWIEGALWLNNVIELSENVNIDPKDRSLWDAHSIEK